MSERRVILSTKVLVWGGEVGWGEGPDESPDTPDGPHHVDDELCDVLVIVGGVGLGDLLDVVLPGLQSPAQPAALSDSSELVDLLGESEDLLLLLPGVL